LKQGRRGALFRSLNLNLIPKGQTMPLSMDIFNDDAFGVVDMTDAMNLVPIQWGRIGQLNLFAPKPLRTNSFQIEAKGGVLHLVQSSERGTDLPAVKRGKRSLRNFSTERFGQKDLIKASDVGGIRAFGSASELMQVQELVADSQILIRGNIDITLEYLRTGALQGQVFDADGSIIEDLFDAFGITQKEIDFKLGTANGDLKNACDQVRRHIRKSLKGDVMNGIMAQVSEDFWDKLMKNDDFKNSYNKFMAKGEDPNSEDVSGGFKWNGIYWEEYMGEGEVPQEDGTTITRNFIEAGTARFFPMGTRTTFAQYNSPADYLPVVNTLGQPFYSSQAVDPMHQRFVEIEGQTNTIPMCRRPEVLVRGFSSN
jgi:hypothetical protein